MKKLMICGAGGVGSAVVDLAVSRGFAPEIVVADLDTHRAERAVTRTQERYPNSRTKLSAIALDASSAVRVETICRELRITHLLNAVDPRAVMPIFEGCLRAGVTYQDMALSLSVPHPLEPYRLVGEPTGAEQFAKAQAWEDKGLLALVGMGADPGLSDVFARHAADELFQSVHTVSVRDGGNVKVAGHEFAPMFSPWTVIDECLKPPVVYEKSKGWFTTEPFSEPELFDFPEGIGKVECVNVEHEEVFLVPRALDVARVDFKYGLGDEFINVLRVLSKLGLDGTDPREVRGVKVSPRDVVVSLLPDPIELADAMNGQVCVGTLVNGQDKAGNFREVYLYNVVDAEWSRRQFGAQPVVWQTAVSAVVGLELLMEGTWAGSGVLCPEQFAAKPYLDLLTNGYGVSWGVQERRVADQAA
jgi:saccharopine dehydrogenase-like NADP-dependent oxidoreductase